MAGMINFSINRLSDECLRRIFSHLSIPRRWIAAQVCSRWSRINNMEIESAIVFDTTDPDWKNLYFEHNEAEKLIILHDILSKTGAYIQRFHYHSMCFITFPGLFKNIIQNFSNVKSVIIMHWISSTEIMDVALYCQNIREFRMQLAFDDFDEALSRLFARNVNLKYVQFNIDTIEGKCFLQLEGKPLEQLTVKGHSSRAKNYLLRVLGSLTTLKTLYIEDMNSQDPLVWYEALSKITDLQRLSLPPQCLNLATIFDLTNVRSLKEIHMANNANVNLELLKIMVSQMDQLQVLDLSDCMEVRDDGLEVISHFPNIKDLTIGGLEITGAGLAMFETLEQLSCQRSTVFDKGLCQVLRGCKNLRSLNIKNCNNLTAVIIETANRIISKRESFLRIIIDPLVIKQKRSKLSPFLEVISGDFPEGTDRICEDCYLHQRVSGGDYFDQMNVASIPNVEDQGNTIPFLNGDCIMYILEFLTLPKRISMERVSNHWKNLVQKTMYKIHSLDLFSSEWALILFRESQTQIDSIFKAVLTRTSECLRKIELKVYLDLTAVVDNCSNLQSLNIYSFPMDNANIVRLCSVQNNLIELSLNVTGIFEEILSQIFQSSRQIKILKLYGLDTSARCFLKLNTNALEILHLSNTSFEFDEEFPIVLPSFQRLEHLVLIECSAVTEDLIIAIEECKNLKLLGLQCDAVHLDINLDPLFELTKIEELYVQLNSEELNVNLNNLSNKCGSLVYLDFTGCLFLNDEHLQAISELPNLQTLIISFIENITGSGLLLFPETTKFKRLECQRCSNISNDSLCEILRKCSHLQMLNVAGCLKIDETLVDTAFEVTNQRTNGIMLQLMAHETLIRNRRFATPPLLELLMVVNYFDPIFM